MSDLCLYELVDNVWDEFGDTDDHIVPGTRDGCWDQFTVQDDSRKKPRNVVMGVDSSADNVTRYGISRDEERGLPSLTKDTMLGKSSWSQTTDGAFPTSCGTVQHKESIACDPSPMSSHCLQSGHIDSFGTEFCAGDAILVDKRAAEDDNVYCYPLNNISQTDNDLSFFNNERDDKESSDLLYFAWPDIGNFEDVDRMFRSCDSTFGFGLSSEDESYWLSTSHAAEGSEDALKQDAKLSGQAHHGTSRAENAGLSLNDSKQKNIFNSDQKNTRGDSGDCIHFSNVNPQLAEAKSMDEPITNEQMSLHIKQSKRPDNSVQKEDWCLENGRSFHHYNNIKQLADVKCPHGDSSCEVFSLGFQHNKQNREPDSINYMQTGIPCMHPSYSSPSDQISMCPTQSAMNSENNGHPTSTKESSYASNQVQSMESPVGPTFAAPTMMTNEKKGKLHHQQDMRASFNQNFQHANVESRMTFHDPVIVQKQIHQSEQDESHSEVEGVSIGVPAELDSSNAQESSCVSSVLDEISLEAASFRQLQQVMERLDIRTKLCIRDSLYRLARSAEQRHNCANAKGGFKDDRDSSGLLMAEDTNKCTAFMDMETETNPIDRSIAHLLFHRPTDQSNDSLRSHAVVHGSITSPSVVAEKHVSKEEIGGVSENEMLTKDSKEQELDGFREEMLTSDDM